MKKLLEPLEYRVKHTDQGVLETETNVVSSFEDLPTIAKGKRIEETWKEVNSQMEDSGSND